MGRPKQLGYYAGRRLSLETLEKRFALDASMLRITEFVASNDNGVTDYDGASSDWLEIYNAGADAVDLSGMYLTDKADNLTKWAFPANTVLPGGGYRVIFASSKNTVKPNGEIHTNFNLSADGEYLGLVMSDGVTIVDQFTPDFPTQFEDVSYGRSMSPTGVAGVLVAAGATGRAWRPTNGSFDFSWRNLGFDDSWFPISGPTGFGYENSPGDAVNYTAEIATTVPSGIGSLYVRIPFHIDSLVGVDQLLLRMKYDDGFVAYINGQKVAEAFAPDSPQWTSQAYGGRGDAEAEVYQDFDVSTAIPRLRVGENALAIHALNIASGSDMLVVPALVTSASAIVSPEIIGYFDLPTPGYGNGESYLGNIATPQFSVPHGFYTEPQVISITNPIADAIIVFTSDGSTPAVDANLRPTNGTLYAGPVAITTTSTLRAIAFKTGYKPSFIGTSSYLFLDDILHQSPAGQTPVGWAPNGTNGQRMDYGIDPDILSLYGAQAVKDSLLALPTINITTDLANLFDPATGIYVNATNDGSSWERPASAELIASDGSEGFSVNAGLRIRGGYSRNDFNPKHAFRLYFRSEYGDGKLEYPLFGDEGLDEYDVVDLRTEQNYSWSSEGNVQNSFVREVFARDLQRDLGQPYTRSRYYHLYLNGQYWGVYMTQERVEEHFAAAYFGGEPEDYDIFKTALADGGAFQVDEGNDAAWSSLFIQAQALADNPSANSNNYYAMQGLNPDGTRNPSLPVLLDVENLINYMLIIIYTGGYDTGISYFAGDNWANNWFGIYNREAADQGFQFFMHDNEHSLGAGGGLHSTFSIDRTGPFNNGNQNNYDAFNPVYLHQDLLSHPEYRQRFIDTVQQRLFNNGPLTAAASVARMQQRAGEVNPAIIAEAARWGDANVSVPHNKSTWQTEINWLTGTYFRSRTNIVVSQLRADGLNVILPTFSQNGGVVPSDYSLAISPLGAGTLYYTSDGATDPRLVGGAVNPSPEVKAYAGPITLTESVTIKVRLRTAAGDWSSLVEASFTVASPGDFDGNQLVEGNDFLIWQRQFGMTASPPGSGADGNFDGVVSILDLDDWRGNYGDEAMAATEGTAVSLPAKDFTRDAAFAWFAAPYSATVIGTSTVDYDGALLAQEAALALQTEHTADNSPLAGTDVSRMESSRPSERVPKSPRLAFTSSRRLEYLDTIRSPSRWRMQ